MLIRSRISEKSTAPLGKRSLAIDYWDIEPRDTLRVFIAETEVASTSMREAQKALESSLLEVLLWLSGYQCTNLLCPYSLGSGSRGSATET